MTSTARRSRTIAAIALAVLTLAPAGAAYAGPDTNIQKPGHSANG